MIQSLRELQAPTLLIIRDLTTHRRMPAGGRAREGRCGATPTPKTSSRRRSLIVSVKRGGMLLGAFDDAGEMKGFVYSIPGAQGRPA